MISKTLQSVARFSSLVISSSVISGLAFLGLVILYPPFASVVAEDEPVFIPLGRDTTLITPKKFRYPRLFTGSAQINFFVQASSLPHILSKNLSTACARGNFNQRRNKRYYVVIDMPDGRKKKFGFADYTGTNLYDPDNRKGPNQVYIFENDKTSQCKVYAVLTEW